MHKALYRVYRPKDFSDIVGQETIVQILKNQIMEGTISHAYLFSGSRGTGKTSMAKVFSKAINCKAPHQAEPCQQCICCMEGEVDIIEIDAASNNSVDNIRDIRDNVIYTPSYGKYKIYIIDEVHMLSQGAFNALLKTLEEPPSHVVFILATTEPQKIPQTVLSRVQRYDFKKIEPNAAEERLKSILKTMAISFEDAAISFIVQKSEGSLRDALSMLDKVLSMGELTYEVVVGVLGDIDYKKIKELLEHIQQKQTGKLLRLMEEIYEEGKDMKLLVADMIDYIRDVLLIKSGAQELIYKEGEARNSLEVTAQTMEVADCISLIDGLSALESDIKYAVNPKVMVESFFVKKIYVPDNKASDDVAAIHYEKYTFKLEEKVKALEEKISQLEKNGFKVKDPILQAAEQRKEKIKMPYFDDISTQVELSEEEKGILEEITSKLEEVYQQLQKRKHVNIKALLQNGEPVRYVSDRLYIGYDENYAMLKNMIDTEENKTILSQVLKELLGKDIDVSFIAKKEMASVGNLPKEEEIIENIRKVFPDVPLEVYESEEEYRQKNKK